ncbi:MAG: histidinol-phosphate transaminase [Deltaproteobacteria bacterium]|nr:histidinol-phosphate transaminase [Deltaproteobacteria bacterium]
MAIEKLVNPHILDLKPYEPGKPMEELERELGIESSIKLASNENPIGPSPKALVALRECIDDVNRYPDGACFELRARLSEKLGVSERQLVFGCGADEILELLMKTFVAPGDEVVMPWPSFAMYPIVIKGMGGVVVDVPLRDDFTHDLDAMRDAVNDRTKVVFVCNPNNPTGTSIGAAEFGRFVQSLPETVVLAVDEAYYEFVRRADFPRTIELLKERPEILVLRTFSKIYGLAGLRIGYGIGHEDLVGYLERARHPFNVSRLAEAAAVGALDDDEHARRTREVNAQGIEYLTREFTALGLEFAPTDTNFLLVRAGAGVYDALLERGVIVRPMRAFGLPEHVRITIGLPEENERLVKALRSLRLEVP